MNSIEYQKMFQVEEDHWWYASLHEQILGYLQNYLNSESLPNSQTLFLDAACGTGGLLQKLRSLVQGRRNFISVGVDFSQRALFFSHERQLRNLLQSDVSLLPFPPETFDFITAMDVLCQVEVDEQKSLQEFYRVLKPEGILLLQVPAFEFLKSEHDLAVHVGRRYTRKKLYQLLEKERFKAHHLFYRNTLLFPVALIWRLLKKSSWRTERTADKVASDVIPLPKAINEFLKGILKFESFLIRRFIQFPFGLSLFCVAKKEKCDIYESYSF